MAKGAWVMRTAVMVSILAHASLIGAAGLRKPAPTPEEPPPAADVLGGTSVMPTGSEELLDVDVMGGSAAETPAPVAPPAPVVPAGTDDQDEAPVDPPKPPSVPDKPVPNDKPSDQDKPAPRAPPKTPDAPKPKPPADKPETPETKDDSSTEKTPEAKDPAPSDQDKPVAQDKPAPEPEKKPARTAKRPKPSPAAPVAATSSDDSPDANAGGSNSGPFGTDAATSIRNLGDAFTRALPPACDSDKVWGTLAAGSAGSIEVALNVDEEGKVTGFEPLTTNPPAHLISAVKRTVANLKRSMAMMRAGSVNPGKHVLRLSAKLSDEAVTEEEVNGAAAFGLDSKWEGRKGVASFTQASGRHVEITVEFVRVQPL